MPSRLPAKARAHEGGGRPALPFAGLHHGKAFGDAPGDGHDQRHHHVGGVLGHHAGGVRHQNAALPGGGDVDMVDARAVIGDQLQLFAGLRDQPGVDVVGDGRHQHIGARHGGGQLVAAHLGVGVAQLDVEQFLHPRLHRLGQASRDDNTQTLRWHGSSRVFQRHRSWGRVAGSGAVHKPRDEAKTARQAGPGVARQRQAGPGEGGDMRLKVLALASGLALALGLAIGAGMAALAARGDGRRRSARPKAAAELLRRGEDRRGLQARLRLRDQPALAALCLAEGRRGQRPARPRPDAPDRLGVHPARHAAEDHRRI